MIRVLLLVSLVVVGMLAGCSTVPGMDDSSDSPSPTADADGVATDEAVETSGSTDTETPTEESGPEEFEYPPGVTPETVDLEALADAHDRRLADESYSLEARMTAEVADDERTETVAERRDPDSQRRFRREISESGEIDRYATADAEYERRDDTVEPRYETTPVETFDDERYRMANASKLFEFEPAVGNYTVEEGTVEDGRSMVRLRATEPARTAEGIEVHSLESTMAVDERGIVREYRLRVTATNRRGVNVTYRSEFELTDVGSTVVKEPSWLETAPGVRADGEPTRRQTYREPGADATVTLVGHPDVHSGFHVSNPDRSSYTDDSPLERGRVSEYLAFSVSNDGARLDRVTITISYDESQVPEGGESELVLYRDDELVVVEGATVDAENGTATATLDSLEDGSYLLLHYPTLVDAFGDSDGSDGSESGTELPSMVAVSDGDLDASAALVAEELPGETALEDGESRLPGEGTDASGVVSSAVHLSLGEFSGFEGLSVSVGYDASAVPAASEDDLAMYVYDGKSHQFRRLDHAAVDAADETIRAEVYVLPADPTFVVVREDEWEPPESPEVHFLFYGRSSLLLTATEVPDEIGLEDGTDRLPADVRGSDALVSNPVAVAAASEVEDAYDLEMTMEYDADAIETGRADDLAMYVYDGRTETFRRLDTTVDPEAETVVGVAASLPPRATFVIVHEPTWERTTD